VRNADVRRPHLLERFRTGHRHGARTIHQAKSRRRLSTGDSYDTVSDSDNAFARTATGSGLVDRVSRIRTASTRWASTGSRRACASSS
jgi:hypothetical protein